MRVLHIGKFYPPFAGGIENFLGDLVPALEAIGVHAGVIVHDHSFKQREGKPDYSHDTRGNLWRVPCCGELLYTPISPRFPSWFARAIREYKPELLHFHLPNVSAFWAMLLPEARRLPWIIHWHSDVVPSKIDRRLTLAYQAYKPFEQKLLGHAAAIIATSEPYLATSKALAPWRRKCVTVPLGLDPERLPFPDEEQLTRARQTWNTDKLKVLAIGRLTYYKGHEFLINAVSTLDNAKAVIVGQGERHNELHDLINSHGLQSKVVLAGGLPPPELNALLATCDCLCLPSLERTEAFGLVLLEAMRFGKAIVASDIPGSGVGFVVQDGVSGQMVPVGDSNGLAQALSRLATDRALSMRLGRAGAACFAERFHIQRIALDIKEIYTGVCNNLLHSDKFRHATDRISEGEKT